SIATIFTLDLYAKGRGMHTRAEDNQEDSVAREKHLVFVGRLVAAAAVIIALLCARPLLGKSDQAFQFIQEFSGFFTPGITVIFLLGLFWKKASEAGAISAAIASVVLSYLFKTMMPDFPFMNRMGLVFLISLGLAVAISLAFRGRGDANRVTMEGVSFRTSTVFNAAGVGVILILIALYATWW
ncbi:MAG TPA: sodium transporter, partial [Sphingomicrobium sp.]|nr:sodium transporter [Sphingomicrobium sp.]